MKASCTKNRWEQDGQSRSKIEIMANNVQLLGGNANSQGIRIVWAYWRRSLWWLGGTVSEASLAARVRIGRHG